LVAFQPVLVPGGVVFQGHDLSVGIPAAQWRAGVPAVEKCGVQDAHNLYCALLVKITNLKRNEVCVCWHLVLLFT
jgi:hypothetical protein